jgi:hypothetical protein
MLKDFDIAFTKKIRDWFSNTIYANTALVYNVAYNLVDDPTTELKFPLISIYRPNGFELRNEQNFAAKRSGIEYLYNGVDKENHMARFISARLPYQIDIYTKSPEDLDDITEDIMHAFNLFPTIEVKQYDEVSNEHYEEKYDIIYSSGPDEQSEFLNDDRIYHYALVYEISNARLVNFRKIKGITSTEVHINETPEDQEEDEEEYEE